MAAESAYSFRFEGSGSGGFIVEPSESAIKSAIDELKKAPGAFQHLAESYARIRYPERFKNLEPTGRRSDDQTVKGWPDASADALNGREDVVEATTAKEWWRHLRDDIGQAEARGQRSLAGFLFIAWAKKPKKNSTNERTLQHSREALRRLDIPPENIEFVFQERLAAELRQPAFARVWQEFGLSSSCEPFEVIEDARIFGQEGDKNVVIPTREEYCNNHVHRPQLATEVEARLADPGWALVRGIGAAGKTVLAAQIGLARQASGCPVYYLDLAEYTEDARSLDIRSAQEVVTSRADPRVLFIIDNVHLYEDAALKMFTHWQKCRSSSHLLMVGRSVERGPDPIGRPRPLSKLEDRALELRARPDDLAGIFARLWERLRPDVNQPTPPYAALQRWEELFGGDLFAFAVAVVGRISRLATGEWGLGPDDAVEYVRETYLDPLTSTERDNLLRVAALATLEIEAPREATDEGGLRLSLKRGVVHRFERRGFTRYRLVHSGMGRLLLAAQAPKPDPLGILIDVARRYPFCGMVISARLEAEIRIDDAIKVLRFIESPSVLTEAILRPGLHYTSAGCERLTRLKVMGAKDVDKRLSGQENALRSGLLRTPLHFIPSFIRYAEAKLPNLKEAMERQLQEPAVIDELARAACASSWDGLVNFLKTCPSARDVVARIDLNAWETEQLRKRPEKADFMHSLFKELQKVGRGELAEAPARALVRHADPRYWHTPVIGLQHVGNALRLSKPEGTDTKLRFLKSVVTSDWLRGQYENPKATAGTIAAALYGLWANTEDQILSHFRIPALTLRVQREMAKLRDIGVEELSWAMQLLGCAALCGVYIDSRVDWPNDAQIGELVERNIPEERDDIGHIQAQLWLGLREMARLRRREQIGVKASLGERMLALWKNAQGRTERQEALNALMRQWLEACARAGWWLQPDPLPIAELLSET